MKQVTFKRQFRDRVNALTTIVYPAGWSGKVADEVAKAAREAKALK
jgi:hypothetical protein